MAPSVSNLDRLYALLEAKTGISRIRDVRLERLAAQRALEMRYQQGLTFHATNPIVHQPDQLRAAVYPWQGVPGVTENATWHYYPPSWVDPIDAAVDATLPDGTVIGWWNSPVHHDQLIDIRWTAWGNGIYYEDPPDGSARRWYFITVLADTMTQLATTNILLKAGKHYGYHLTADGKSINRRARTLKVDTPGLIDDRQHIPGRGPMVHMADAPLNHRWLAEGPLIQWL